MNEPAGGLERARAPTGHLSERSPPPLVRLRSRPVTSASGAVVIVLFFAAIAGCAAVSDTRQTDRPEVHSGQAGGYLAPNSLPDSLALLPSPPTTGSASVAADEEANRSGLALRGSPRWQLATSDADLTFPHAPGAFSCAAGVQITPTQTPRLIALLSRTLSDAGAATGAAKDRYRRERPFMVNGQSSCAPASEERLRANGSYPSGHSAIGWTWALILAEIVPDRADAILQRGRAFGDSRVICNVHWQSDVTEGRVIGAAVVARLHADASFRADLEASRVEIARARVQAGPSVAECEAEAAVLHP